MGVEMDEEGDLSDGGGCESGCGAGAGRRGMGGGSLARRAEVVSSGPPRPPASHELVPARASKDHGVRVARASKMATGVHPATVPSVPPPTVATKVQ